MPSPFSLGGSTGARRREALRNVGEISRKSRHEVVHLRCVHVMCAGRTLHICLGWHVCRTKLPLQKIAFTTKHEKDPKTDPKCLRKGLSPSLAAYEPFTGTSLILFTNKDLHINKKSCHCKDLQGWPRPTYACARQGERLHCMTLARKNSHANRPEPHQHKPQLHTCCMQKQKQEGHGMWAHSAAIGGAAAASRAVSSGNLERWCKELRSSGGCPDSGQNPGWEEDDTKSHDIL